MRISSNTMTMQWQAASTRQQASLLRTQLQVATGRKAQTPGDDPDAVVRALGLNRALDRVAMQQDHVEAARARLNLEEQTLSGVTDVLERLRELAVRAGGPAVDDVARQSIAAEANELFDSLLQQANAQDGRGEYLFAGSRVKSTPFTAAGGTVLYHGDQNVRQLQIGDSRSVPDGDSGERVFREVYNGNGTFRVTAASGNGGTGLIAAQNVSDLSAWDRGDYTIRFVDPISYEVTDSGGTVIASGGYTAGDTISFRGIGVTISGDPASGDAFSVTPGTRQDLFETVRQFITALETPAPDAVGRTAFMNRLGNSLEDLDRGLEHIADVRTQVGARLVSVESQREINDGLALELESTLSTVQDLDYAEALSRLENQLFSLEASQKAYLQMRQLSLFSFL